MEIQKIEKIENLLRFTLTKDIGSVTMNKLLTHFGLSERILGASEEQLREVKGLRSNQIKAILAAKKVDPRHELDLAAKDNVKIIAYDDPMFPKGLRYSGDPPYLLYVKGSIKPRDLKAVGVVGTRHASRYGREQSELFGRNLAQAGITIVSGLARGVDTYAHRGALSVGGRTIAVVGCGFNHVYPPENRDLLAEISRTAAVVTEFPMDTSPSRTTFPRRNRIIAGMSLGILVVEAPIRSGALITARQALEIGREIFAVPGQVDIEQSQGCHKLIREGAVLTRGVEDIISELSVKEEFKDDYNIPYNVRVTEEQKSEEAKVDEKEQLILHALGSDSMHIDQLCAELRMNAGEVSAKLMILELRHVVMSEPGAFYRKIQ